jgi:hypothetical protein
VLKPDVPPEAGTGEKSQNEEKRHYKKIIKITHMFMRKIAHQTLQVWLFSQRDDQ